MIAKLYLYLSLFICACGLISFQQCYALTGTSSGFSAAHAAPSLAVPLVLLSLARAWYPWFVQTLCWTHCKVQGQWGQKQEGSLRESFIFCSSPCITEKGEKQFLSILLTLADIRGHFRLEMNWLHYSKSHGRWIMSVDEPYLFTMAFLCHEVLAKSHQKYIPCWQQLVVSIKLWDIKAWPRCSVLKVVSYMLYCICVPPRWRKEWWIWW